MPTDDPTTTAAGIPYEDTDCTADEAVEAVKAVRTTAACPEHALPLLPDEKIQAFVTLLDWPGTAAVTHACEARLVVEREWLDVYR